MLVALLESKVGYMKKNVISIVILVLLTGCAKAFSGDIRDSEIVFATRMGINDNPEIFYLVDLKGNKFPLPKSGSASLGSPALWLPIGDLLAYTDVGQDGQYIVYSDLSGNKTQIGPGYLSSIAPDGKKIVYLAFNNLNNGILRVSTIELSLLATLDDFTYTFETMPRTVWDSSEGFYFDHLDIDGTWRIYHYDLSKKEIKPIVAGREPSISHNGKQLAFIENESICLLDLSSTRTFRLPNSVNSRWPSWSPDDEKIVFSHKKIKSWEICILDVTVLSESCLTDNEYWDGKPEWRP
jgi:Tol biopolymer transport system component